MALKHSDLKCGKWYEIQRTKDKTHAGYLSYIQEVDGFPIYHVKWQGEMYNTDKVIFRDILCTLPEPRLGRRVLNYIKNKLNKNK